MAKNSKTPETTEKLPSSGFLPQIRGLQPTTKPQAVPAPDDDLSLPSLSKRESAIQANTRNSTFLPGIDQPHSKAPQLEGSKSSAFPPIDQSRNTAQTKASSSTSLPGIGQPNSRSPQQEGAKSSGFPPIDQSRNTAQTNTAGTTSFPGFGRAQADPTPRGNIISLAGLRGAATQATLSNPNSFKAPSLDTAIKNSPPIASSDFSLSRDRPLTTAVDERKPKKIKKDRGAAVQLTNKGGQDFPESSPPERIKNPKSAFDAPSIKDPRDRLPSGTEAPIISAEDLVQNLPDPGQTVKITTPKPAFGDPSVKDLPNRAPPDAKVRDISAEDIMEDFDESENLFKPPISDRVNRIEGTTNDDLYTDDEFEPFEEEKSSVIDSPPVFDENAVASQSMVKTNNSGLESYERLVDTTESLLGPAEQWGVTQIPPLATTSIQQRDEESKNQTLNSSPQSSSLAAQASLVKEFSAFFPSKGRQGLSGVLKNLETIFKYDSDLKKGLEGVMKLNPSLEELNRYKEAFEHMYKKASLPQDLTLQVKQALEILKPLSVINEGLLAARNDGEFIRVSAEVASMKGDPKAKPAQEGSFESYHKDKRIEVDLVSLPREINPRVIFAELASQEGFIFHPQSQTAAQIQSEKENPSYSPAKQVFNDFQLSPLARQNFDANTFAAYLQQQTYKRAGFAEQYRDQVRTAGSYKELATAFFTAYQAATQTQKEGFSLPSKAVIDEAKDHIEKIRSLLPDKDNAILISRSSDKSYTEALVKYCEVQGYKYNDTSGYTIFKNEQEKRLYAKGPEAQAFKELANAPRGSNTQEKEAALESSNESAPSRLKL